MDKKLLAIRTCLQCGDRYVLMDAMAKLIFIFPHETMTQCHVCGSPRVRVEIEMIPEERIVDLPHASIIDMEVLNA